MRERPTITRPVDRPRPETPGIRPVIRLDGEDITLKPSGKGTRNWYRGEPRRTARV
jgi:hypothetical protein